VLLQLFNHVDASQHCFGHHINRCYSCCSSNI
jgi:hypothetical protein